MKNIYISSDKEAVEFKNFLIDEIEKLGFAYQDLTQEDFDFVDSSNAVCESLLKDEDPKSIGIVLDRYGAGSYIACNKHKGIVAANVSDERSALMTKRHNGARILVMGSGIIGHDLARTCLNNFLTYEYDGGRHQIRIDMLNKMM
ncbi:MAG: RpiB/LacA/LacB family sugar-phosphate isomerase [Peptoniphilaceae bacterium]|nr:RpiB/LacA/LacB family sugar-phosphate isomerase [Peptoniphilaceae bacterium]MDY6018269.1 RpiB/LacA/LacB family sugar-phosphate isomerase [Anaerococcus sp.]